MQYRQTLYRTLTGKTSFVELSEHAYGECIVYSRDEPKYHVDVFDTINPSNHVVKAMLDTGVTIEQLLSNINKQHNTKLNLRVKPLISIEEETNLVELDLLSLPEHLLINIDSCSF